MASNLRILRIALWTTVALALAALVWFQVVEPRLNQPAGMHSDLGKGDYQLVTTDGQPFTQDSMKGQPTAVFFGFTHCPDVCPTTLGEVMAWQEDLEAEDQELRVLFVTVDPERDTQEILGEYVSWVPGVTGITGTPEEIAKATRAFRVYARKAPLNEGGYNVDHSTQVLLFDAQGDYFGLIGYQEPHERAMGTLRRLLAG